MRKRRGIDRVPAAGVSRSGDSHSHDGNHETTTDAPEHETSPRNAAQPK
jgi:hypothetical protein